MKGSRGLKELLRRTMWMLPAKHQRRGPVMSGVKTASGHVSHYMGPNKELSCKKLSWSCKTTNKTSRWAVVQVQILGVSIQIWRAFQALLEHVSWFMPTPFSEHLMLSILPRKLPIRWTVGNNIARQSLSELGEMLEQYIYIWFYDVLLSFFRCDRCCCRGVSTSSKWWLLHSIPPMALCSFS